MTEPKIYEVTFIIHRTMRVRQDDLERAQNWARGIVESKGRMGESWALHSVLEEQQHQLHSRYASLQHQLRQRTPGAFVPITQETLSKLK